MRGGKIFLGGGGGREGQNFRGGGLAAPRHTFWVLARLKMLAWSVVQAQNVLHGESLKKLESNRGGTLGKMLVTFFCNEFGFFLLEHVLFPIGLATDWRNCRLSPRSIKKLHSGNRRKHDFYTFGGPQKNFGGGYAPQTYFFGLPPP